LLTSDLVRARRRGEVLKVAYLRGEARARALGLAEALLHVCRESVGEPRGALLEELSAVPREARDELVLRGLEKLVLDGCRFEPALEGELAELREALFRAAAERHRALGPQEVFDRRAVLDEEAARRGVEADALDAALYGDLRENERLVAAPSLPAERLLERYDVGLAQAMLLRATKVTVLLEGSDPLTVRALFRRLRFLGLLAEVRRVADDELVAYAIEVDGPFSLFESVQRYGLRLALFLPYVLALSRFRLRAEVLWGKERLRCTFDVGPEDELISHAPEASLVGPDLDAFRAGFEKLASPWRVSPCDRLFVLPGERACIPDLTFTHEGTGEEVHLEAFGYWSRQAVWQRVELLRELYARRARGERDQGPARLLLAVSKKLRVSEEVLGDEPGEVYVYAQSPSPRAVLERLERGPR
jgi:predicted nuclease of restriction endonuclease-like RecB superfamily